MSPYSQKFSRDVRMPYGLFFKARNCLRLCMEPFLLAFTSKCTKMPAENQAKVLKMAPETPAGRHGTRTGA